MGSIRGSIRGRLQYHLSILGKAKILIGGNTLAYLCRESATKKYYNTDPSLANMCNKPGLPFASSPACRNGL
jgi:hypothetical protein